MFLYRIRKIADIRNKEFNGFRIRMLHVSRYSLSVKGYSYVLWCLIMANWPIFLSAVPVNRPSPSSYLRWSVLHTFSIELRSGHCAVTRNSVRHVDKLCSAWDGSVDHHHHQMYAQWVEESHLCSYREPLSSSLEKWAPFSPRYFSEPIP